MNKQEKFILAETCANKISVLAEKQDKLFEKLKLEADNEYFIDALFDYCFNNGEYSAKLLNKYLNK